MRISSVETFPIGIPLAKPVQMSHVTITKSNNVLVKVSTDEGIVGWGEGVEAVDLTGETQARIKASIDALGEGDELSPKRYAAWLAQTGRVQRGRFHDNLNNRLLYMGWLDRNSAAS